MPYHLCGWSVALGTAVDTDIAPIQDNIMLIQNGHFVPQTPVNVLFAAAMSPLLSRAKWATPKTRQITNPFIRPLIGAALPPTNPNVCSYLNNPFKFNALEEIQLLATSAITMSTERFTAFAGLSNSFEPVPAGDIYRLRGTSTTAAVANVWSQIVVTWADTLPAGQYAAVGLEVQSTNAQGARLIFQNQSFRPGTVSVTALANRQNSLLCGGSLGVLGRFLQTAMPLVEVVANGADAVHEVYLDIIRIG